MNTSDDNVSHLLFNVIYGTQESCFQLPKYDTVEDLKNEISKRFGVPPNKQIIECWNKTPENNNNTLITCCLSTDCNFLIVSNSDDFLDISDNIGNVTRSIISGTGPEEALTEPETSAILSFIQYFSTNVSNRGITFHVCTLEDAIRRACSTSLDRRQVLVLYFHNKKDVFANTFCQQLITPEIQVILNKFFLLCWDIEDDRFKKALIEALHKRHEFSSFDRFIENKTCAALLVVPVGESIGILSVMKGRISSQDFINTMNQAERFIIDENNLRRAEHEHNPEEAEQSTAQHTFGSKEYQQLMLDLLGDRDYDSFDYFEHKFLKDKIGYALYGPPQSEDGYNQKQKDKIESLFKIILEQNNLVAKWKDRVIISVVYNCTEPLPVEKEKRAKKYPDYKPDADLTPYPVFILRKCKRSDNPCRIFIDDIGRVYKTWNDYLTENKLPECEMIFPINGRYAADNQGQVILGRQKSPACSVAATILQVTDIASAVGGIASGGALLAGAAIPAVAAAPFVLATAGVVGAGAGIYSIGRSVYNLIDRSQHEESLNLWESSEARGAYFTIVAGSLGFVGAGANMAVSRLAAQGFNIGKGATATVNAINIVNIGASGIGVASASYDVIRQWWMENERPSLLTIVQLSSSILFFGHAVYNFRSASTIIEESQANALKEYQDSLRSNRHRKTFNKLMKETVRQNQGNVQKGQAEVISTIKNIQNKDEVFATLTRSNKHMNKNNVRFAADNGEIKLNGVSIDMTKFTAMEKNEVITFLTQLPSNPNPTTTEINAMKISLTGSFPGMTSANMMTLALGLAKIFCATDHTIKEKIINAVSLLIKALVGNHVGCWKSLVGCWKSLDLMFPNHEKYFKIFTMVNSCFQSLINIVEEKYQKWLATKDPRYEEPYFIKLSLDAAKRATEIFNIVTKIYFVGTHLTQTGLEKLLDYFATWFAKQVFEYEENQCRRTERTNHSSTPAPKIDCRICGGKFYSCR